MLTVRFPNGAAIVYNAANYIVRHPGGGLELYTSAAKDRWVASMPPGAGVIVEAMRPCRVEAAPVMTDPALLELVLERMRSHSLSYSCAPLAAEIKAELRRFDARTGSWKA